MRVGLGLGLRLIGSLELTVRDRYGRVKDRRLIRNVITDVGKAQVAGLINGVVTTPFKYVAIGTGTTAASASDTALEYEVARKEGTTTRETTNVSNDTAVVEATFSSADGLSGSMAITEAGLFDASSGGNMLCRRTFDALNINWDAGDTLTIKWKVQVTA